MPRICMRNRARGRSATNLVESAPRSTYNRSSAARRRRSARGCSERGIKITRITVPRYLDPSRRYIFRELSVGLISGTARTDFYCHTASNTINSPFRLYIRLYTIEREATSALAEYARAHSRRFQIDKFSKRYLVIDCTRRLIDRIKI